MYDTNERVAQVKERAARIKQKKEKRMIRGLSTLCLALCCCLVGILGEVSGGFGSAVLEWCARHRPGLRVYPIGIEKPLVAQGTIAEQRAALGLDGPGIARRIGEDLECKPKVD